MASNCTGRAATATATMEDRHDHSPHDRRARMGAGPQHRFGKPRCPADAGIPQRQRPRVRGPRQRRRQRCPRHPDRAHRSTAGRHRLPATRRVRPAHSAAGAALRHPHGCPWRRRSAAGGAGPRLVDQAARRVRRSRRDRDPRPAARQLQHPLRATAGGAPHHRRVRRPRCDSGRRHPHDRADPGTHRPRRRHPRHDRRRHQHHLQPDRAPGPASSVRGAAGPRDDHVA